MDFPPHSVKDPSITLEQDGILLSKFTSSNFYGYLQTNLKGLGIQIFKPGRYYLTSYFVMSMKPDDQFAWMRYLSDAGAHGHGPKLVTKDLRRVSQVVRAISESQVDPLPNPGARLGEETESVYIDNLFWVFPGAPGGDDALDLRLGGFQVEEIEPVKPGVAVIGDSTTAGSALKIDHVASQEWTTWAAALLNVNFFNRAIGGDTTADMRARWAADISPLAANAKYCIVQGGLNDIAAGRELGEIKADLQWMADRATSEEMWPIMATATPTQSIAEGAGMEAKRQDLNAWIREGFARVLDFDEVVRDPADPASIRKEDGWFGDGVHYDAAAKKAVGYSVAEWEGWDFPRPSEYQRVD